MIYVVLAVVVVLLLVATFVGGVLAGYGLAIVAALIGDEA